MVELLLMIRKLIKFWEGKIYAKIKYIILFIIKDYMWLRTNKWN